MTDPLPFEQRVMLTELDGASQLEPIPGQEVCDFCGQIPVVWAYDVIRKPIEYGTVVQGDIMTHYISDDGWGACQACHELIDADDRDGLITRSIEQYAKTGPLPRGARASIAIAHANFFAVKHGPGEAWTGGASI